MNATHAIIDLSTNAHVVTGIGADLFGRSDLLGQPTRYKLVTLAVSNNNSPAPAPERIIVPGTSIDPVGKARIEAAEEAMRSTGLAPSATWFAAGTDMLECGEQVFHAEVRKVTDMLPAEVALDAAIAFIASQKRRDCVIDDLGDLTYRDGCLVRADGHKARLSTHALTQLFRRYPEVKWSDRWATAMSESARDAAINDGIDRWKQMVKDNVVAPRASMLRVMTAKDDRIIYAVVGPTYPARLSDADAILAVVKGKVQGMGARAEIVIDPNTSRLVGRVAWADTTIVNPKVGDIFNATITFTSRDDAGGRFRGNAGVIRVRCINCSLSETSFGEGDAIHRSAKAVLDAAGRVVANTDKIQPLLRLWGYLRGSECAVEVERENADGDNETVTLTKPEEIATALCSDGEYLAAGLRDAGIARDVAVEIILRGWTTTEAEGDTDGSIADVVNAVTRAAQDRALDRFQQHAMEIAGGRLVKLFATPLLNAAEAK